MKIGINKQGCSAYIKTGVKIYPTQWDAKKERIKDHPNKTYIQGYIDRQKAKVLKLIMEMTANGELVKLTATQIKNKIVEILEPEVRPANSFYNRFIAFSETREAQRTREIYRVTAKRMIEYDKKIRVLSFEDINKHCCLCPKPDIFNNSRSCSNVSARFAVCSFLILNLRNG